MDTIIQSPGFKVDRQLEAYLNEKLEKLDHMANNIIRAHVTLFTESDSTPDNHYCEIRLEVPGYDPFVKKNAENFEMAITEAVDTMQRLLQKQKEKFSES